MASPAASRVNSLGLQRFGLGLRLGQPESIRAEARELLLAEVANGAVAQPANLRFSGAAEIGAALYAFEDEEKLAREARRAAAQAVPGQGMAMGGAPTTQIQMPQPKSPGEPALPFRTYRDEVLARVELALAQETGFGERLVQFWSNHFCIAATKSNMGRIMAGAYEREAIRPHVFGRFEAMLIAAESHPAMLDFLDNRLSIGPGSPAGQRRGRGLNENLAREILELHTLGVSGGYAQADVTNLARIITGWTVVGRDARLGFPGSFAFNPGLHEPGAPLLLGRRYGQPGKEGAGRAARPRPPSGDGRFHRAEAGAPFRGRPPAFGADLESVAGVPADGRRSFRRLAGADRKRCRLGGGAQQDPLAAGVPDRELSRAGAPAECRPGARPARRDGPALLAAARPERLSGQQCRLGLGGGRQDAGRRGRRLGSPGGGRGSRSAAAERGHSRPAAVAADAAGGGAGRKQAAGAGAPAAVARVPAEVRPMAEIDDDCERMTPSRRAVLGAAGALFAWSFMPKFAHAAAGSRDSRFLLVVLRGALDGLSAVPPLGDPDYAGLREGIALAKDGPEAALPLDGFFYLHPAMPHLARLYAAGQASIAHACATGYRERSHFDGQDVLESGQSGPGKTDDGWLNRLIASLPAGEAVARKGVLGVGVVPPLVVRGEAPVLGWAPPRMPRAGADLMMRLADLYGERDPALAKALAQAMETEGIARRHGMGGEMPGRGGPDTVEGMRQIAEGAAALVGAEDGPRIAALAFEGWDTHANEGGAKGRLATLLSGLDGALASFEQGLRPVWKDTVVMVVTEFGRTAAVNGTVGTDHGTGTVAFLIGGAVKGQRMIADWPGLRPEQLHERRDLKPTTDIRAVAKGVVADLFGLSGPVLAEKVFPGTGELRPMQGLVV